MRLRHLHLLLLVVTLPVALHARWAGGGKAPGVAYCKLTNTTNCGGSLRRFVPFGYIYTTATRCFAKRQSAPTFADIDGDGVAELITGQAPQPDGWIKEHEFEGSDGGLWTRFGYYKKTGDATNGDSAGPIYGAVYPDAQYTPRGVGAQFPSTPANPPRNGAPYPFPADMFPDTKNILHPNAKKNSNNDGYGVMVVIKIEPCRTDTPWPTSIWTATWTCSPRGLAQRTLVLQINHSQCFGTLKTSATLKIQTS